MKKSTITVVVGVALVVIVGIVMVVNKRNSGPKVVEDNTQIDLPINTIPLEERPIITLRPDSTGRSLDISLSQAPATGNLEYEMIYNASGKQEGALGSIFLGSEKQPIVKSILLGSKSGGGKITYHEGVTGGSITVTYGETRLKESWNYLHFDPTDPIISATDGKFHVTLPKTALKKDAVIVTMKTFGYPTMEGKVVAGPYGYFAQTEIKGTAMVELKLPAGEHVNPTIYEYSGSAWKKLPTKLTGDTVSATATGSIFVVTAE
ncbi:hypothetical protein KBD75_02145 [Candidatus Woesebacteria bacterium]|nr:hypothetical protein [Candidatus Woesebacteria bacterium]